MSRAGNCYDNAAMESFWSTLKTDTGLEGIGEADSSPEMVKAVIDAPFSHNIATGLSKVDPAGASSYQANADAYVKELQALDAWAKAQFATLSQAKRKAITSHDAFGYLAAHYGLTFLAPQGVNTDTEPSARQVGQLIRQIQREKIRAVFVENMGNPKLLAQLSQDAGVTPGASLYADALSSADKPGATYLQMMRHNVTQLVAGMQLN